MEKRPNNNLQVKERYNEEFDYRYYRIVLGAACLSVVIALIMMAAGAIGLLWLIKTVFGC